MIQKLDLNDTAFDYIFIRFIVPFQTNVKIKIILFNTTYHVIYIKNSAGLDVQRC